MRQLPTSFMTSRPNSLIHLLNFLCQAAADRCHRQYPDATFGHEGQTTATGGSWSGQRLNQEPHRWNEGILANPKRPAQECMTSCPVGWCRGSFFVCFFFPEQ